MIFVSEKKRENSVSTRKRQWNKRIKDERVRYTRTYSVIHMMSLHSSGASLVSSTVLFFFLILPFYCVTVCMKSFFLLSILERFSLSLSLSFFVDCISYTFFSPCYFRFFSYFLIFFSLCESPLRLCFFFLCFHGLLRVFILVRLIVSIGSEMSLVSREHLS